MEVKGNKTVDYYHKTLGKLLYDYCGLARNEEGLKYAIEEIRKLKQEFYQNVTIPGVGDKMNGELEKAGRVADYFEIGELMCYDALTEMNPAVHTSGRNIKPRTGKRLEMMLIFSLFLHGAGKEKSRSRSWLKSLLF